MSNAPPGIDPTDYANALRRQQMADILQSQALSPLQAPQAASVAGRTVQARISPLSGLSKIAEALMAKKAMTDSTGEMARIYGNGLNTFAPGGGQPASDGYSSQPSAPQGNGAAGPPPGAPSPPALGQNHLSQSASQAQSQGGINPLNPFNYPPQLMYHMWMTDKAGFLKAIQGTPEYQNALAATNGDRWGAARMLADKAQKDSTILAKSGESVLRAGQPGFVAPDVSQGMTFSGDPSKGPVSAQPIAGATPIVAERAGITKGAQEMNTPVEVKDAEGRSTFVHPTSSALDLSGRPVASPGAGSQPAPSGGSYFKSRSPGAGSAGGGLQTTSGAAMRTEGGKTGQEYSNNMADDAAGATTVRRSLGEMKNLAKVATPGAFNNMKMQAGSMMMAAMGGSTPEEQSANAQKVAGYLGVDVGALQAMSHQSAGLAVGAIHQMTSRGTNFDLSTFMANNPNAAMTPGGFSRLVDYMDKSSKDIIEKQRDFQTWKRAGDNGKPVSPEEWKAGHTAHWNKIMEDRIESGQTNSRRPIEDFVKP